MGKFHQILALIVLPLMLFSFTGTSIHFHICSHTGKVYSDIQLADFGNSHEDRSCCNEIPAREQQECNNCQHPKDDSAHSECCIDLEKKIETDKDYKFSYHSYNLDPAELNTLFENDLSGNNIAAIPRSVYLTENILALKVHSSVVLLL